jgi:hypothetical protein
MRRHPLAFATGVTLAFLYILSPSADIECLTAV